MRPYLYQFLLEDGCVPMEHSLYFLLCCSPVASDDARLLFLSVSGIKEGVAD